MTQTVSSLREELLATLSFYGYPEEVQKAVPEAFDRVFASSYGEAFVQEVLLPYSNGTLFDYPAFLEKSKECANALGFSYYLTNLLFCLLLVPYAYPYYEKQGISRKIYEDSMRDILFKVYECLRVKGEPGVFVAFWFDRWFSATRYAFGRLQFEASPVSFDADVGDFHIKKGDVLISVHIPGDPNTPLSKENCDASYEAARKFYAPIFPNGKVIFRCASWMLLPAHQEILPETSNIRRFASEYITIGNPHETDSDLWRIFGASADPFTTIDALEERTNLQKIYKTFMKAGGKPGAINGLKY